MISIASILITQERTVKAIILVCIRLLGDSEVIKAEINGTLVASIADAEARVCIR